jgi:hypothetical protein
MISQARQISSIRRSPAKTFQGRERLSLFPRWIVNYFIVFVVSYFMISYGLNLFGISNSAFDPFKFFHPTPTPTPFVLPTLTRVAVPAVQYHSSSVLSLPTYTPYPTYTPLVPWMQSTPKPTLNSFTPDQVHWVFSYYYPDLLGVNCHQSNYEYNKFGTPVSCANTSASGLPWRDYLFGRSRDPHYVGGVAVPYYPGTRNPIYPMRAVVTVTSPAIIAGDWLVMDICPACGDYQSSYGVLFLDFLSNGMPQGINFWSPVTISKVVYP